MTEISAIPICVAVAEQGSFAAAARSLGITKSAVSKRIGGLEAHLGTKLFHRSTRNISLTEAGEIYLAHAVQALGAAREAEDAVAALQGEPVGHLKLSVPMSFGQLHVAPALPEFLRLHPGVTLELSMDDRVTDLVETGMDLALRAGTLPDSALIARRLAPIHSVLVAAPDYLRKSGMPRHPQELVQHDCLHYAYSRDPQEWRFLAEVGEITVRTRGRFRVNNSEALCTTLLAGLGIGRLPSFIAGSHLAAGRLTRVLPDFAMPAQALYAVFPERQYVPAKVRAFIDFFAARVGQTHPYWDVEAGLS
ncbi:LysR substrate-binding domain-containing protein [Dinoroseobacter sp. S76]|uniref:LysR family transcriptional regulator n=1 Tax=Dinoroseobacter sp. S76 TaxID=3415124 RepID=UPI003C7A33B6